MADRLNYLWRLFATGFSFFVFGAAGTVLWAILFPLAIPFLGSGVTRKRRARYLMNRVFRCYVEMMRLLGILSYEVHGMERLNRPGRLIIANHPSLIDVVFLISFVRNATCIVKPALAGNLFMRAPIKAMDYIFADDAEAVLDRCAEELREGCSLIVFPEGTRTTPEKPMKFRRGAANIALKSGARILPVYIHCYPTTLTKNEKWYQIPARKVHFRFFVGDDVDLSDYAGTENRSIASRKLTHRLLQCLQEQAEVYGRP